MAGTQYDGRDLEAMSFAARYHAWILSLLRPYLGKRVAEVGAGSGSVSAMLLSEPLTELVAVEPSENMFPQLKAALSGDARAHSTQAFFPELAHEYAGHFDTIIYINVLEHVADDAAELSAAYEALAPGGYIFVFVPALAWLYSRHDARIGHHRRYYKKQLIAQMEAAGFHIADARYFDFLGVLPWFLLYTLLGGSPGKGAVGLYDRAVVPVARVFESLVRPPLGKNLIVVGRKESLRP